MLTKFQKDQLAADLDRKNVRQRSQSGRSLSYIEGWHAIAEANRIFGFDGWMRETLELKCVAEHGRKIASGADAFGVTYIARVRITVIADIATIVREGSGTGHGIDRDLGQAHEGALKEAETDAMKRALMTFGNPFGLALYDKEQAHVSDAGAKPAAGNGAAAYVASAIETMRTLQTKQALQNWWASEKENRVKHKLDPEHGPGMQLRDAFAERAGQLKEAA